MLVLRLSGGELPWMMCSASFMSPSPFSPQQFEELLPLAAAWAEEQEARILANGVALSGTQMADAQWIGVAHPERVRLLAVPSVPRPRHPILEAGCEATGLLGSRTLGLTLRYGIFVREDFTGDRFLIAHELVHTSQYERLGGISEFLRQYLHECLTIGYPEAPMEQEAIVMAERLRDMVG